MFIFIDVAQLTKIIKQANGRCAKCQQTRTLELLKTYYCLRIFFFPIWQWKERYFVVEHACGYTYETSEEDAVLAQYGKKDLADCRILEVCSQQNKCMGCHQKLETDYDFCPYCGEKRKQEK